MYFICYWTYWFYCMKREEKNDSNFWPDSNGANNTYNCSNFLLWFFISIGYGEFNVSCCVKFSMLLFSRAVIFDSSTFEIVMQQVHWHILLTFSSPTSIKYIILKFSYANSGTYCLQNRSFFILSFTMNRIDCFKIIAQIYFFSFDPENEQKLNNKKKFVTS